MELSVLVEHLWITLVVWLGGLALGGAAGALTAQLARPAAGRRTAALIPWRALLVSLALLVWSPFLA